MTESPFPFGAVEGAPAFDDEPTGDRRRNVIALGALAAVLVGGGAYFLLSGGSDTADEFAFTPAVPRPAAAASPSPQAAVKLPVATKIAIGRNPFKALYVQPVVAAAAPVTDPAAPAPTGGGTPIVIVSPGDTPTGPTTSTPTTSRPTSASPDGPAATAAPEPAVKEYKLILKRVFGDGSNLSAVFTVDGKQMTAKVGSTFGPTAEIKLLSLQQGPKDEQWTAVLQVGDGSPFDVVTGEPVFVR
ncbi:MAG: hypothetical protein H7233_16235 [Pseudorhodobacter sp.]|nr:hypothetical protein [Frankiaceae bacterium]